MKRNPFYLMLLASIGIFASATYAQENKYIVSKYDFIPGEKVIFFDDFTAESVGDFPAKWLTNGSGEIVTAEKFPGKWFHITKMGYFIPETLEDFTDNFTIEFDFIPINTVNSETMLSLSFYLLTGTLSEPGGGGEPGEAGFQISLAGENLIWKNWSMQTEQRFNGSVTFPFRTNEKYHVAIWVQKQRVRFYANENKVLDVPRAIQAGSKPNIFRVDSRDEAIPLIGNFRIAAGLPDMRNRLLKDGKIISYGILFDVNSDKLKPESYSTLKEISDILKENPAIRIQVVGHTDSDGDEAPNLDLSKRRGASVKNELVSKFAIDAARLETDGKGESVPLAPNDSPVNKAKNRRVEFINLRTTDATVPSTKISAAQKIAPLTDPDGNVYKTVTIRTQTWMAENLKTSRYNDGTIIPLIKDSNAWLDMTTPGYCWFNNDESTYKKTYGALYNWYAVNTCKLCPSGWRVPTNEDWKTLMSYVGGTESTDVDGGKLREAGTTHWKSPNKGATNATGFTALPGSDRDLTGSFGEIATIGEEGVWWTSTEDSSTKDPSVNKPSTNALIKGLSYNHDGMSEGSYPKGYGLSVRCVKD
ncbi:MAG: hypothetical protein C0408_07160 [Odoribacter sp.]|nr:hypothetical protein [Odoribacter sp.]